MTEIIKKATVKNWFFWVSLVVSVTLGVTGFFMPPQGEVHGSVLTLIGLFLGFATLGVVWHSIKLGVDIKLKYGKAEMTAGDLN